MYVSTPYRTPKRDRQSLGLFPHKLRDYNGDTKIEGEYQLMSLYPVDLMHGNRDSVSRTSMKVAGSHSGISE